MKLTQPLGVAACLGCGEQGEQDSRNNRLRPAEIISMLQDVAENVSDLEEVVDCISDELDCIEEDLDNIDDYLLDDEDDDDYEDYDEDEDDVEDAEYDFGDDEVLYEVKCPTCGEEITIDEQMLDEGSTVCPNCGEELEFDLEEDEEEPKE